MKRKTWIWITGFAVFFSILFLFTFNSSAWIGGRGNYDFVDGPRLLSPVTEDIDLTGKTLLEFKWMQTNLFRTDHYEFKLYKGYDTVESTLILKQSVSLDDYPIQLPAAQFEVGQVYTWSLRQVFLDAVKSDRSYGSFTIIKK